MQEPGLIPVIWKFGFRIEDGIQTIFSPRSKVTLPNNLCTFSFLFTLPLNLPGLIVHRVGLNVVCSHEPYYDLIISGGSVRLNDALRHTAIDHPLWVFIKNAEDANAKSITLKEYDSILSLALRGELSEMDRNGVFASFPINQRYAYLATKVFNPGRCISTRFTFDIEADPIIRKAMIGEYSIEIALCFIGEEWGGKS